MKKYIFLIFCLSSRLFNPGMAQVNLVPNPSFEDTVACPDAGSQVARARYWHSLDNTPDYFHECCAYPALSVPDNIFGHQYAATGDAYVGLCDYSTVTFYRETIGTYLTSPLTIGEKYYVTIKTSLAWNPFYNDNAAANNLGILFSTSDYLSSPPPINNFAQVYSDSIITDSINWTTIRGSFIADSAYTFISISNFFDDSHTDTIHIGQWNDYQAYYYIDDICVSADSIYSEMWASMPEEIFDKDVLIYPNPTSKIIFITNIPFHCHEIDVLDIQGMLVKSVSVNKNLTLTVDVSLLDQGIYLLIFKNESSIHIRKFVKI